MPCVLNFHDFKHVVLPPGAVYIGRANPWYRLSRSKWANPFDLPRNASAEQRAEVIRKYEQHLVETGMVHEVHELRGKDLVCWCAPKPCHGDLLLQLANG